MPRSSRPAPTSRSPGSDASQPATTGPKSSGGSASCTPCSPMTGPEPPGLWAQLAVHSTILLPALVPLFSAASVAPLIAAEWQIDAVETSLLTGAGIAAVYPVAMKVLAGWFRTGRGLAVGILIGAITLGSAVPHGLRAAGAVAGLEWRPIVLAASASGIVAALIAWAVREGPLSVPAARLR